MSRLNKFLLATSLGALLSTPLALANDIVCDFSHINNHYSLRAKGTLFGNVKDVTVGYENQAGVFSLDDLISVSFTEPKLYEAVTSGDGRVFNKYKRSYIVAKISIETEKTMIGHHPMPGGPTKEIVALPILCRETKLLKKRDPSIPPPMHSIQPSVSSNTMEAAQ